MAFVSPSRLPDWRAKALRNHLRMVDLSISITMKINAMSIVFRQWLSYHKIPRFSHFFKKNVIGCGRVKSHALKEVSKQELI